MTQTKTTRKERDRQRRKDDFLNAAETLYAGRGYFQTSMEDVAQEAGYATGTLYRYFSSKEDLYHSLLIRKGHVYFNMIKKIMKQTRTPVEKLHAVVHNKVRFFFENAEFMRIYITEVNAPCDTMNPPEGMQKIHEQYMQTLADIFQDGMQTGVFRKMDVNMLLLAFTGMSNHLLCQTISTNEQVSAQDAEQFILNFLKSGLSTKKGWN